MHHNQAELRSSGVTCDVESCRIRKLWAGALQSRRRHGPVEQSVRVLQAGDKLRLPVRLVMADSVAPTAVSGGTQARSKPEPASWNKTSGYDLGTRHHQLC